MNIFVIMQNYINYGLVVEFLTGSNDPRINSYFGVFWKNADEPVLLRRCFLQS